jgi:hypothetical protein
MLEQLIGSNTMFGTLETQVLLRMFGFLGFTLIVLWALSPLGGQASLRLLNVEQGLLTGGNEIRYYSTNQTSMYNASLLDSSGTLFNGEAFVSGLYASSLLSANKTKSDPVDSWGNLRVPRIQSLDPKEGSDGWRKVPPGHQDYYSLMSLPLVNVFTTEMPPTAQVNFSIESAYMNWNCHSISNESFQGA